MLVPDDVLTSGEVAKEFRVRAETVARWADEGKLAFFRTPGGQRRYRRADVDAFKEETATEPEPAAS